MNTLFERNLLLEEFRGWVSPNGEKIPINSYAGHDDAVEEIFNMYYPFEDFEEVSKEIPIEAVKYDSDILFQRGWLAVVSSDAFRALTLKDYKIKQNLTDFLWKLDPSDEIYLDIYDDRSISGSGCIVKDVLDYIS